MSKVNEVFKENEKNYTSERHKLNIKNINLTENEPIVELTIYNSFIVFKNDFGVWDQNSIDEMIIFWIKQRSKNLQICDEKLLETLSVQKDRADRSVHNTKKCSMNYFKRITRNKEVINRN